jgi:preprotein translocase subunit SecG
MGFLIGLLTVVMVLDCVVLIFLVLIQLPKKEAGAGLAFGGAATDALFGAGSGNVLTKITKYAATIFFVLAVLLAVLQRNYHYRTSDQFMQDYQQPARPATETPAAKATPSPATPAPATPSTPLAPLTSTTLTNTPAAAEAAPTNAAPK